MSHLFFCKKVFVLLCVFTHIYYLCYTLMDKETMFNFNT